MYSVQSFFDSVEKVKIIGHLKAKVIIVNKTNDMQNRTHNLLQISDCKYRRDKDGQTYNKTFNIKVGSLIIMTP